MRPLSVLRFFVLNAAAVAIGATVSTSCISVNYPTVAFRCNPRQSENCPSTHFCCSDDPAAVDCKTPPCLPNYTGLPIPSSHAGTPVFSANNNQLGTSGMCVRVGDIPSGSGLQDPGALNCPIPCNPTWSASDINAVCGQSRVCCQTVQLDPRDCVNDNGTWRPATGADILSKPQLSDWSPSRHKTHQDPGGKGCATFANGTSGAEYLACLGALTVANQRGFCMALGAGQVCPTEQMGYVDACTALNNGAPPPSG